MRVLYISYDGLTDFLGQSQVLPYLLGCAAAGHAITVISFEKPDRFDQLGDRVRAECETAGIGWLPQTFRTSPPYLGKWLDQRDMAKAAFAAASRKRFDLVHCRSYPPAMVGLRLKKSLGIPLIFDMRGFWPDSRREGGRWTGNILGNWLYRRWKRHEAELIAASDHIVSLTHAAAEVIRSWPAYRGAPISIIPCCADFEVYVRPSDDERLRARRALGLADDAPVLVYVGSLGTIYLLGEQLRLFDAVRRRLTGAKLLVIGQGTEERIIAEAKALGIALSRDDIRMKSAERSEIGRWISVGDVGMCFYVPTLSSLAVSPTKLAEYLACGVPAIGNAGIGDFRRIVEGLEAGHVMPDFSAESVDAAADAFVALRAIAGAAVRSRARPLLDLPRAVEAYAGIYGNVRRPSPAFV